MNRIVSFFLLLIFCQNMFAADQTQKNAAVNGLSVSMLPECHIARVDLPLPVPTEDSREKSSPKTALLPWVRIAQVPQAPYCR